MDVLIKVLSSIKPSKDEEILVNDRIKNFISKIKVKDAKVILGGSGAKDTWLKTTNDADIFVQFNYSKYNNKSDLLSDILEKSLKKSFKKIYRLHGSRDYFQVRDKGFTFEIVPILEIKKADAAINITDVSPLHALFVKAEIKKNKKIADEIRLMKQFCKSIRVYGAESYINGFSGYMCEILTIYYGSFINLIKAASKWNNARKSKISGTTCGGKEIIDAKNFYKGKNILMEMNKSKTYSPLILVDPVQKDRNAAAALSFEKYDIFRKKAIEFLKKPSEKFFEIHLFDAEKLKKDNIVVCVEVLDGKEDIVGAKTLKIFMFLKQAIIDQGFYVKESGWHWDKGKTAYLYFKINKELDKNVIVRGPPANLQEHINAFKRKHKKTFVKDGIIYAEDKQKITKANDFIKSLLKKDYVLERAKSAKVL